MADIDTKRINNLVRLLEEIAGAYHELGGLVQKKTDAMKRADLPGMRSAMVEEQGLVRRLNECEGLRRQMMDAIGQRLGLPSKLARTVSASQLAIHLPEPEGQRLLAVAERLKETMARVARINRVAAGISREILGHLKAVFSAVTSVGEEPVGYSGTGAPVGVGEARLIEAVG